MACNSCNYVRTDPFPPPSPQGAGKNATALLLGLEANRQLRLQRGRLEPYR